MRFACVFRGDSARQAAGEQSGEGEEGEHQPRPGRGGAFLAAAMVLLSCCLDAGAVVGGTPVPAADRQLDAVALLITDQPWAPCGGWVSGSCTLVGPNLVLMARHSVEDGQRRLPAAGGRTHKVRFRRGIDDSVNSHYGAGRDIDCAGGFQEIYVQQFAGNPWPGVDMVLAVLERAPIGITPLPLRPSHAVSAGEPVVLAGWGFDGQCLNSGEAWTLRSKAGVLPPLMYNSWCCFDYNLASFAGANCFITPVGSNWVIGNMHDSGAPLLSPDPAEPSSLRVIAMVTGVTSAQKISAWNEGGGLPLLSDSPTPHCLPDTNQDGVLSVSDLFTYVERYLGGDVQSDVDGLPGLTPSDLYFYLLRYFAGC